MITEETLFTNEQARRVGQMPDSTEPVAVRVRGLVKRYADGTEANRGIDLELRPKDRSLEIMQDLIDPNSGIDLGFEAQDVDLHIEAQVVARQQMLPATPDIATMIDRLDGIYMRDDRLGDGKVLDRNVGTFQPQHARGLGRFIAQ